MSVNAPLDRVRWASVLAGLFTALVSIIVLTILGVAIGLSTVDANNLNNLGLGAGIYGAAAAIISFALGGYMAARTAAVTGRGNGSLNGFMVWVVAIPLIVNLLGTGIGSLLGTATNVAATAANTAAQVAAPVVGAAAQATLQSPAGAATAIQVAPANSASGAQATVSGAQAAAPGAQASVAPGVQGVATQVSGVVDQAQAQLQNVTPQDVENAAHSASGTAWGVLAALVLSGLAAALGGLIGWRNYPTEIASFNRATSS